MFKQPSPAFLRDKFHSTCLSKSSSGASNRALWSWKLQVTYRLMEICGFCLWTIHAPFLQQPPAKVALGTILPPLDAGSVDIAVKTPPRSWPGACGPATTGPIRCYCPVEWHKTQNWWGFILPQLGHLGDDFFRFSHLNRQSCSGRCPCQVGFCFSGCCSGTSSKGCVLGVEFPHRRGALQCNSALTLSTWRWHQLPPAKGSVPQDRPQLQAPVTSAGCHLCL